MNEDQSLTFEHWLSQGWRIYKENTKEIIAGSIIYYASLLIIDVLELVPLGGLFGLPAFILITPSLYMGWCFLCLRIARREDARASDIFSAFSKYGTSWATFFLYLLIVLGGTVLFIIPGIIFLLKYSMSFYAVMDKNMSATAALEYSRKITHGYLGKLLVIWFLGFIFAFMAFPFSYGLQHLDKDIAPFLILGGTFPYLLMVLVFAPWLGIAYAAAYDSIAAHYEKSKTVQETA